MMGDVRTRYHCHMPVMLLFKQCFYVYRVMWSGILSLSLFTLGTSTEDWRFCIYPLKFMIMRTHPIIHCCLKFFNLKYIFNFTWIFKCIQAGRVSSSGGAGESFSPKLSTPPPPPILLANSYIAQSVFEFSGPSIVIIVKITTTKFLWSFSVCLLRR